ncbi:MAG: FtsW/RodA/SpoVE family cell cycle protein, partial [Myxococcota bacterium]
TRSPGWAGLAVGTLAAGLVLFALFPDAVPSRTVATRLQMWTDPWLNGLPYGDQLARARWALAAGGLTGSGFGASEPGALPAGHTDLVYAHLVEELGLAGAGAWLLLGGIAVADGLRVAARSRTPERALMAAALAFLIVAQAAVILGGTLGAIPLTGVVVPFLSYGKTSMAAFVGVAALIARLGEDAEVRADTDELVELRAGVRQAQAVVAALAVAALALTAGQAVWRRDATTLRGVVTTLGDGTPVLQHDPRLATIAARVRRGSVLDRDGRVLAESPTADLRLYPLGDALGTVLGPSDGGLLRPKWSVERQLDATLRGWPDRADPPTIWLGKLPAGERLLLATAREGPGDADEALRRLRARGGEGDGVRKIALAAPDLSPLLPLARLPLSEREAAVAALSGDTASRTVKLTLDARLQAAVAKHAKAAAKRSSVGAAAVVVMDADTGEVLARAQWPDYDPGAADWLPKRLANDPTFMGIYGAWSDKTGAHGTWQAGSVFKVLTALAAVREGFTAGDAAVRAAGEPPGCVEEAPPSFTCDEVTDGRTSFRLPGWEKPIHDFGDGGARGEVDLVEGLTRSSNVWFGQLALKLGPEPFRKLRAAGVEFGNPGLLDERDGPFTGIGEAGSRRLAQTGFGQGAGSWNVTQAARVVSAVATGGTYRRCPSSLRLGEPCAETKLLDGQDVGPVLAGMRGVMTRGTGARLPGVEGVRVYGKTGTADAPGTRDEAPWKIRPGQQTQPHSWFVAIAEPDALPECGENAGRLVVAAVVPHGGFGAAAAGPLAMAALTEAAALGLLGP